MSDSDKPGNATLRMAANPDATIEAAWLGRIHARLDHRNLNDALPELAGNTTSERLADWILGHLARALEIPGERISVEVWETATCGARVSG